MFEKIKLQLLSNKGTNSVSTRTLEEQAQLLSSVITTDEQLTVFDFKKYVETLGGNISHDVAEQARLAKEELEKKYKGIKTPEQIAAEKAAEEAAKKAKDEADKAKGISPEMAALMEQQKQMMDMISKMQGEKITTTRSQELNELLKDAPKAYKDSVLAGFSKAQFADDDDFNAFKETQKVNYEGFQQMAKESGITFPTSSAAVKKPVDDGRDSTLASASKLIAEAKAKETKTT